MAQIVGPLRVLNYRRFPSPRLAASGSVVGQLDYALETGLLRDECLVNDIPPLSQAWRTEVVVQFADERFSDTDLLEESTLKLRRELLDVAGVISVDGQSIESVPLSKSAFDAEIGTLILTVAASRGAMRAIIACFSDWTKRNADKRVSLKEGSRHLEITGLSESAMERIIAQWREDNDV